MTYLRFGIRDLLGAMVASKLTDHVRSVRELLEKTASYYGGSAPFRRGFFMRGRVESGAWPLSAAS